MPTYDVRSGKVRARVCVDGRQISKTFDNKADAKLWALAAESQIPETNPNPRYSPPNFLRVLEEYQALELEGRDNDNILVERLKSEPWVSIPLEQLTTGHLFDYKRNRLKTIKASTFSRYWCLVKLAANCAKYQWNWEIDTNLFAQVKIKIDPPTVVRRVSDDIIQTLIATANGYSRVPWLVPVIEFAVTTGLRRKEIADLTWGDVDFERRMIVLTKTKTNYPRTIPLTSEIEQILTKVFPAKLDANASVFGASVDGIRNAFRRVRDRAGVNVRFHDFRHEAVSSLFEMGLTPIEVASISGHRTMKSLMRYSHADTNRLLEKMEGVLA